MFSERTVYDNRRVRLGLVDVQAPNGSAGSTTSCTWTPIAIAVIVDDQNRVLMLWRYRRAWRACDRSPQPSHGRVTGPQWQ
jgi:hypothetical protein